MPNCFTLTKIGDKQPAILKDLDTELWIHFEGAEPENNDHWYRNWYNTVGFALALGKTIDECFELTDRPEEIAVIQYLKDNYTTNA